jgi:fumarylacetoacetate (FAA) hydrolase family protein
MRRNGPVSSKSDYTPEEWKMVVAAPYYAAMFIIVADMNLTYFQEIAALGKAILESASASDSDLIKGVAVDFSSKETQDEIKPELDKLKSQKDFAALKKAMVDYITSTADLVASKSAQDGADYCRWLVHLAQKTAEGSKEGGFLGIGAVRVSDSEQAALDEMADKLGVSVA